MSDQLTSQSRPSSGISRRTALRGAAWSASAVTVVVAAPAHANTSGATPTGSASTSGSTRNGSQLNLQSLFTAGPQAVSGLSAFVTVSAGSIATISTPAGWTLTAVSGNTAIFSRIGDVAGGAAVPFSPVVALTSDPAATVTSTISFSWTTSGSASVTIPLASVPPATTGSSRRGKDLYPVVGFTAGSSLTGLKASIVVNTGSDAIVGKWLAAAGWTKAATPPTTGTTGTYTYDGTVAAGAKVTFAPHLELDKNPDATVTATITLSWAGGSMAPVTISLPK